MSHAFGIVLLLLYSFAAVVRSADVEYMKSSIQQYFSESRHHRNQAYKTAARDYLYNEFKRFGLETEYHHFKEPKVSTTEQFTNVIGLLKGAHFGTAEDRVLGVVAHYDTVLNTKGVDDNGSGCTALLEVAKQVTGGTSRLFQHTILFMAVDLEEKGYVGTNHFIKDWMIKWLTSNYKEHAKSLRPQGVFVLDTLMEFNQSRRSQLIPQDQLIAALFPKTMSNIESDGFAGDFILTIFREPTGDKHLASNFVKSWQSLDSSGPEVSRFEIETFPLNITTLKNPDTLYLYYNFLRSDHQEFWKDNIPAVFLTDSANSRGDMVECYHAPCDDLDTMLTDDNLHFLSKTADALSQTVQRLAEPRKDTNGAGISTNCLSLISLTLIVLMM